MIQRWEIYERRYRADKMDPNCIICWDQLIAVTTSYEAACAAERLIGKHARVKGPY